MQSSMNDGAGGRRAARHWRRPLHARLRRFHMIALETGWLAATRGWKSGNGGNQGVRAIDQSASEKMRNSTSIRLRGLRREVRSAGPSAEGARGRPWHPATSSWRAARRLDTRRQARRHRVLGQDGAAVGRWTPASQSASRSQAMWIKCGARRSAPTASASSPHLRTGRRGCGTRRAGKPVGDPLRGHTSAVLSTAFSPDGKRIVTASADKTARLWDAETGEPISTPLTGHAAFCVERGVQPRRQARSSPPLRTRRRGCGKFLPTPRN